jgi:hypothetical protein
VRWLLVVLAACGHPDRLTCADDLRGVYDTPARQRWMLLDNGATLEAYPMFDDSTGTAAPRAIDLERADSLAGTMMRRYGDACVGKSPFHVVACTANGLDVVYADPLSCTTAAPSRAEHWGRE